MSFRANMRGRKAFLPSGYRVEKILLRRHDGSRSADRNITPLVVKFELTESIYSPTVVAKFGIKDGANLMEEFPIVGHERIILSLAREEHLTGNTKRITIPLIVTEFPLYNRAEQPNLQVYTISAVAEHGFIASITSLSRKFKEKTVDEIYKILTQDIGVNPKRIVMGENAVNTRAKGIIPQLKPFEAIEYFRSRSCDDAGAPLYVFQTIDGWVHLKTQSDFVQDKVYGVYKDSRHFKTQTLSKNDYAERASRILEMTSNMKLGRVFQAQKGAFASKSEFVDIATKSFGAALYSYDITNNNTTRRTPYSNSFTVADNKLTDFENSFISHISINTGAYGESETNTNLLRLENEQRMRAHVENLELMSHDIRVYGDFYLNPGNKIELQVPRAMDPMELKKFSFNRKGLDSLFSGRYIVTSCNHTFENGEYFINARIKRDSLNFSL